MNAKTEVSRAQLLLRFETQKFKFKKYNNVLIIKSKFSCKPIEFIYIFSNVYSDGHNIF